MIALAFLLVTCLLQRNVADATIGVNWGRQNAQKFLPSNVVDLLLQNGIGAARIFTTEVDILKAFEGSGIALTINIANPNSFKTIDQAEIWFQARSKYLKSCNVRQIYVADYIFAYYMNKALVNDALQAMQSLQKVLNDNGLGDQIKVTIPNHKGVLKMSASLKPSEAEFLDEIKPVMTTFVGLLQENDAPFVVTINSMADVQDVGVDFSFAFADNRSWYSVTDVDGAVYTNMFEVMYDSYVCALEKLKATKLKVIVGQVGWPTDGYPGANVSMAERYYKSLLPLVSSNKGTPKRPGAPIDVYIQSLTDENRMAFFGTGTFVRHWGIFMSNGRPKYKIDLSGRGRDNIYPTEVRGIMRMPDRWCVYKGHEPSNSTRLKIHTDRACSLADCTSMAPGASCSHLGFPDNVSYAFNMLFQARYQDETECDFDGLAHVSTKDLSTTDCVFPIEVVKPEQQHYLTYAPPINSFPKTTPPSLFPILFSIIILISDDDKIYRGNLFKALWGLI